jgi:hypothetical protein
MLLRRTALNLVRTNRPYVMRSCASGIVRENVWQSRPKVEFARTFATSVKSTLLSVLNDEIAHEEAEEKESHDEKRDVKSSYKLASESKSGEMVLAKDINGYKIKVMFNAVDVAYDYPEDDDAELMCSLPIKIEITPANGDVSLFVTGDIETSGGGEEEGEEEQENPYFTLESVKVGNGYSPDIDELDEELQDSIATWLDDFEIDANLFQLALDHATKKETQLYQDWLKDFKKVVEAGKH